MFLLAYLFLQKRNIKHYFYNSLLQSIHKCKRINIASPLNIENNNKENSIVTHSRSETGKEHVFRKFHIVQIGCFLFPFCSILFLERDNYLAFFPILTPSSHNLTDCGVFEERSYFGAFR